MTSQIHSLGQDGQVPSSPCCRLDSEQSVHTCAGGKAAGGLGWGLAGPGSSLANYLAPLGKDLTLFKPHPQKWVILHTSRDSAGN